MRRQGAGNEKGRVACVARRSRPPTRWLVAPLPVQLHARLDDRGIVRHARAVAGDLDVVERELEVLLPVPVDARGEGVHGATGHGAIVQVERVVAQAQLPQPLAGLRGLWRRGHAALAAPVLPGDVPDAAEVAAGPGELAAGAQPRDL